MSKEHKDVYGCMEIAAGLFLGGIACLLISLCSCTTAKQIERVEVPVVVTQEHTIEHTKIDHIRDTLIQRDSVYYFVKGDTTIIERWHYTQGNTIVAKADTLYLHDSIPYPVTTERIVTKVEQVAKPLNWLQKFLMISGGIGLIGLALGIAYKLRKHI